MADAIRGVWQSIVSVKRNYLNPHEHFGRMMICRCALASYVGIYILAKMNSAKKAKALQAQKAAERKNIISDAVLRAGL